MKISFTSLGWKKLWRSPYWKKSIFVNILLGFFALYLMVVILFLGIGGYFLLEKLYPDVSPFVSLNGLLPYIIIGDLLYRYFLQKLPVLDIKSFLLTPIPKSRIVTFLLNKTIISFFNILPLLFWIPFGLVNFYKGDVSGVGVIAWILAMWSFSLINNFINFLAEKNNYFFTFVLVVLVLFTANRYWGFLEFDVFGPFFMSFSTNPPLAILPWFIAVLLYYFARKVIYGSLYLDEGLKQKTKIVKSADLSFVNRLGSVAPFIKNDIRMIWRNKRPKKTFLISFLFVFYGLIFFVQDIYKDMPYVHVFAAIFTTGGFAINFGQLIPAWDSKYYNVLMTQRTSYKDYLNSKYILMACVNIVMFTLASFYILLGWKIYSLVLIGFLYNIGVNNLFLLWAGAFNKKAIDLDAPAMGNTQGSSANQFLAIIPLFGLPCLLFYLMNLFFSYEVALIPIASLGVLGLVLKPFLMSSIAKLYIKRKYTTIKSFNS